MVENESNLPIFAQLRHNSFKFFKMKSFRQPLFRSNTSSPHLWHTALIISGPSEFWNLEYYFPWFNKKHIDTKLKLISIARILKNCGPVHMTSFHESLSLLRVIVHVGDSRHQALHVVEIGIKQGRRAGLLSCGGSIAIFQKTFFFHIAIVTNNHGIITQFCLMVSLLFSGRKIKQNQEVLVQGKFKQIMTRKIAKYGYFQITRSHEIDYYSMIIHLFKQQN